MKRGYKKAFALPTVLIASVVMMIVLLAAVTATSSMRVSLATQYYNQLAKSAAEAGVAYAKSCLDLNNGVALWTDDKPLTPGTDCAGVTLANITCPGNALCYLVNNGNVQTTFSVEAPDLSAAGKSNNVKVTGYVNLLRSSTGQTWKTYEQAETVTTNYTDDGNPVGTSISGYWSTAPSGYLLEDGSAVSRSTYSDLFAVIGTTYGSGDGSTTFNLPDSRGRVAVNLNPNDAEFDTLGEKYGEKTHTWTVAELPSHNHGQYTGATDDGNWSGYSIGGQYAPGDAGYWYTPGQTTLTSGNSSPANVIQPSIVKLVAIKYLSTVDNSTSTLATGTSIDGYWNSVTAPDGYLVEDGSAVSRTTYAELFATIGTTYGSGDGSTTFNLPDSRGRVAVNLNPNDTEFDTLGEKYGEKKHTMTITEMPSHNHGLYIGATDDGNWTGYTTSTQYPPADAGTYANVGLTTLAAGGGVAANVIQPSIVKLSVIKYTKPSTSSSTTIASDITVGTSISGWWTTVPEGYLAEDGSAVSRTTYAELFATIGTTYGSGDGSTTFNLPDSRGRATVNQSSSDTQFATIGAKYGEKTHTMSLAEMPTHSHGIYIGTVDDGNWSSYSIGAQPPPADSYTKAYTGQTTISTGGGSAYNVIQPSIAKLYAIKAVSNSSGKHSVSALVVAGGGGGGNAGGGGAGGLIYRDSVLLSSGSYSVVVGGGGVGGSSNVVNSVYVTSVYSGNGGNSSFVSLSAIGGGGGGMAGSSGNGNGLAGGSGGGSGSNLNYELWYGGAGTVGQGNSGGNTASVGCSPSGGGGGAGAAGSTNSTSAGGAGGIGLAYSISGTSKYYAGGGGGGAYCVAGAAGGSGGGGAGTQWATGGSGTANTGGGGGGGSTGGAGGSGIVIISYPTGSMSATGGTITTSGGRTIHTFTSSGTFTIL